jgi:hypothetical protein
MADTKVRRTRICARISVSVRDRLSKYCAASGISERAVIENALRQYLEGSSDFALLLRRLDRLGRGLARDHRDLELLSEAFGCYMRLWFVAHAPSAADSSKAAARAAGENAYKKFAEHVGEQFGRGHRFTDDLPREAIESHEPPGEASDVTDVIP